MNTFAVLAVFIPFVSALTVNTPMAPVVCEPLQITWSSDGSSPPYYLSLIPAGQPSASALKQFPPQQGTSYTWDKVTLPANTGFTVSLKDGNGQQVYSAPATVQDGGDTSCVNHDVKEDKDASTSSSANSTSVSTAAANSGSSSSSAAAAAATGSHTMSGSASAASVSHKSETAKPSSSASPSQSIKANSVARDISFGAIGGIMFGVGLISVLVTLVVL